MKLYDSERIIQCIYQQIIWRQRTNRVWRIYEAALWIHQQLDEKPTQNCHFVAGWCVLGNKLALHF